MNKNKRIFFSIFFYYFLFLPPYESHFHKRESGDNFCSWQISTGVLDLGELFTLKFIHIGGGTGLEEHIGIITGGGRIILKFWF